MRFLEHRHTTLRHNIKISNVSKSSINRIVLMQTCSPKVNPNDIKQYRLQCGLKIQEFAVELCFDFSFEQAETLPRSCSLLCGVSAGFSCMPPESENYLALLNEKESNSEDTNLAVR